MDKPARGFKSPATAESPLAVKGKALFIDRDGTLIVDKVYLSDPNGVELIPGSAEALRRARQLGYRLFLFSNQSGVGRGYHTIGDTLRVNARMETLLGLPPPLFDEICLAPEAPGGPVFYRKPSPRFILETVQAYGLDPQSCWMVGDAASDIQAAMAAGIRAAAVRTGKIDPATFPEIAREGITVYADFWSFAQTLR